MEPRDEFRPSGSPMSGGSAQREVGRLTDELKDQAKGVASQAREGASKLAGKAREQARSAVEERKGQAASSLDSLSNVLHDSAGRLRGEQSFFGDYAESAAERVDRLARYLRDSDPETFVRDAEAFARRRPEVFMGGMLVAGLLLGRFLKSSPPHAQDNDFVYAGGGTGGTVKGTTGQGGFGGGTGTTGQGGFGGGTGTGTGTGTTGQGGFGAGGTGTLSGSRSDADIRWQPESGAYGGSTPRSNSPAAGTPGSGMTGSGTTGGDTGGPPNRRLDLAPDDKTDPGL